MRLPLITFTVAHWFVSEQPFENYIIDSVPLYFQLVFGPHHHPLSFLLEAGDQW